MSDWVGRHFGKILAGVAVLTILLAGITVWLTENKLPAVQRIGSPCRSAFARGGLEAVRNDTQCTLQAELIFTNLCDHHPVIPGCRLVDPTKP